MLNIQGYVIKWEDEKIYKLKKKKRHRMGCTKHQKHGTHILITIL